MDGSFSELPRRSTRRVLLESRRDFESQSPPFHHRSGPSVDRKRKLSSESGGMGREREGNGGREGEGERRGGRDMTYNKRSSNTLYTTQHKRPRIHSNSGTVSMDTIVPLRRSKREKRLIFSNLNQQEIYHHMIDGPHYSVVDFSDDELDPYEKILSPVRRRQRRTHPSSPHSSPRSQSHPSPGHCVASTKMKLRSSALEHSIKAETSEDAEKEGVGVSEDVKTCSGGAGGDDGSVGRVEEEEGEEVREGDDTEEHEEEDKEMDDEEEEEEGGRSYYLRKRRPVVYQYQPIIQVVEEDTPPKKRRPRGRRASGSDSAYFRKSGTSRAYQSKGQNSSSAIVSRRIHRLPHAAHDSSSTSSSGSDTDEARFCRRKSRSMKKSRLQCLPMNFDPSDLTQPVIRDRQRIGASLADIDPMNINREVTFESIGGLKQHIRSLKEMILFPLLYPEVFDRFKIQPPRGVLFYGPPGCGKTLVARALANECSKGGKTVAFFMRKGADCLSKWVGESERQLRLLFDQAYQLRPSIIFFDEIDGLAPVRSTRQDQIHSSIVSTLLALMDGLDSRGEVVVIGATNRIDAIDPALRRPGRFDREFLFPLPSREDRACIISIHTQQWSPPLKPSFISQLADQTVGYCGADLRSLCTEAALSALRRTYPQIYNSQDKLVLDVTTINVSSTDFHMSLDRIVPTARRSESSPARALRAEVVPLLLRAYGDVLNVLEVVFNPAWKAVEKARQGYRVAVAMETQRDKELEQHILSLHNNDDHHDNRTNSFIVSQVSQTSQTTTSIRTSSLHSLSHSESRTSHFVTGQQLMSQKSLSDVFESSQPDSSEDRVYYEMNDVVNEVGGVESITMETDNTDMEIVETDDGCRGDGNQATDIQKAVSLFNTALSSSHPHILPSVHRPRLLLCGPAGGGQSSHLGPALLHALEEIPVKVLDLSVLFGVSSCTPEESLTQLFKEAKRVSSSVLYLPRLNSWWSVTTETFQATFTSCLLSLPPSTSLIVIATAECPWNDLPSSLKRLFDMSCETFSVTSSLREERKRFFADVLLFKPLQPSPNIPPTNGATQHKTLPIAPPPKPRQLAPIELQKMDKQRGSVLRELRMFLREATNKLLAERKFKEFSRSVDPEEVPDYYDIIKEPMDLGTIMKKIDEHKYTLPKQWLEDVDRINKNALEYNPARDPESRLLLHRAVALQDMAHSILEHELSEDFEQQCEDIEDTYRKLGRSSSVHSSPFKLTTSKPQSHPPRTPSPTHSSAHSSQQGSFYERRRSLRQKGLQPEEKGFDYYCTSRTPRKEGSRGLNDHKSHDHQADRHYDDEKEDMDHVQEEEDEGEGGGGEGHKIDDILIEDVPNEREMEGRRGEERGEREGGEDEGAIESGWDDDEEMNTPTQDIISSVRSSRRPSSKSKRRKRRHLLESSKQYQNIEVVSCSGTENGISKREKQRMRMGHRTKRDVLIDEDHDMVATRNCLHDDRFNNPKHDFKSDSAIIKIPQLPRRLSSAKQRLFDRSNSTGSPSTHHRSNEDITMATSENENTRNGAEDSDRESQSSSQKVLQNTERDTGRCIITHVQNSASDRSSPAVRVEEDEEEIDSRALRRGNGRSNSFATGHTSQYASDGIDGNGITTSSSSTLLRKSKSKATPTITDVDDNGIVMTTTKKGKSVARTLSADVKSSKRLNTEENGADGDDCVLVKLKNKNVGRNLCNGQVAMATSECWLGRDGLAMRAGSSGGGDHDMEEERETRAMDTCHWEETNDNEEQISNLNSTQCNNGSANSTRRNSRNGTSLNSKSTQDAVATSSSSLPGNPIAASNNINPMQPQTRTNAVQIDRKRLLTLFERVVDETVTCSLETMEKMLSTFNHLVFRYRMREDRRQLNVDLELAADLFL